MLDLYPGGIVSVKTTKSTHKTKAVVLTLGAWAAKFLPKIGINVPLQVGIAATCSAAATSDAADADAIVVVVLVIFC